MFFCLSLFLGHTLFAQNETVEEIVKEEKQKKLVVEFSLTGGFYQESISLELLCPGTKIYYTTDGSLPDAQATPYRGPIRIKKTTLVQAIALQTGRKSKITGNTYFIEEAETSFPIISLGVTPSVLFDSETGLYVQGPNANDSLWTKDGANFWSRREVLIHTEFFEVDRKKEFSSLTGF